MRGASPPRGGHSPAHRPWDVRRRRLAARHAARLLRSQPLCQGPYQRHRHRPPRWRCRACTRCSWPSDLNPDVKEAWHAVAGKDIADTPRPPLAEGEAKFVGDPVALVVAESRYVAEDAVELVDVDYDPLPAVADFTRPSAARRRCSSRARRLSGQRRGRNGRSAARRGDLLRRRARRIGARVPADLRAGPDRDARPCRRMGGVLARADDVGVHADPARTARVRRAAARHPRAERPSHHARHRRWVRPEGRPDARGHVHHAGRPQGARLRSSGSRTAART